MTFCVSLGQLATILGAMPIGLSASALEQSVMGITTDSRQVQAGNLFVALRGDRFDGHAFVAETIAQGALAAITDQTAADLADLPRLVVADTLVAYQTIARWWRQQFTIPVIAVTGSFGKTTTKELIAAVLSAQGSVLKTQANYNNEIGVPKTLLELRSAHDYAVVEMAMRAAGEIALLTEVTQPTLAVITNVGTAHIGRLGSEQAIADAKCELLQRAAPDTIAILNYDDPRLMVTAERVWSGQVVSFGLTGGDVQGEWLGDAVQVNGQVFPLPLAGRHNAVNYLAALAVAQVLGVDWSPLTTGLAIELPQGRARRYTLPNDIVLLDETYNAGLESMTAALRLLIDTPGQRHVAVLGTMKELGDRSVEFHHKVGQVAQELGVDRLLILADEAESQAMAAGASALAVEQLSSHAAVVDRLQTLVQPGDRVLFKASRAVGLDRVLDQVVAGWQRSGDAG